MPDSNPIETLQLVFAPTEYKLAVVKILIVRQLIIRAGSLLQVRNRQDIMPV